MLSRLHQWHQTKAGLLVVGLAELALAYGFASLAIDRGRIFYYLISLLFLFGALQNLFKLSGRLLSGNQ